MIFELLIAATIMTTPEKWEDVESLTSPWADSELEVRSEWCVFTKDPRGWGRYDVFYRKKTTAELIAEKERCRYCLSSGPYTERSNRIPYFRQSKDLPSLKLYGTPLYQQH